MKCGRVKGFDGAMLVASLPGARIGECVRIGALQTGEVRGIDDHAARIVVHGSIEGIAAGTLICVDGAARYLPLGVCALGRCIDAVAFPLDGGPRLSGPAVAIETCAPAVRAPISAPFWTGIRAIDTLITLGFGSRVGIFGAPGCGKTTLLEAIVRGASADAIVIALVGERGREAEAWMRRCDRRTTIVCATSDRSAAERVRAARVALSQACALRSRGLEVLLLLDSFARVATALRELAVANRETAGRGGFPPSVFAELARMVECCGPTPNGGAITLIATVLDDGDDRDPVSDAARSLLDGHITLSERLARERVFPAIDVAASVSRTMSDVVDEHHRHAAGLLCKAIASLKETADARTLGLASPDGFLQCAIACEARINDLLRQGASPGNPHEACATMFDIAASLEEYA
jgi:ATP synthase in type III secretion protein N